VVIVDTTVFIDYLSGRQNSETEWLDSELGHQPLGLTDLILCEVLQGIRKENEFEKVRRELTKFDLFDGGGEEVAVAAAQNYRILRQHGRTVRKTIDCLIATFCLMKGFSLLHRNRDFDHFEQQLQLKVIRP
jgi:predicted nucleic acid-binding protein